MRTPTLKLVACGLLMGTLLVACGGGDDATPAPTEVTAVPDEAIGSPEAFTEWAKSINASESSEPLGMGNLDTAPSSETAEPVSLG